MDCLVSKFRTKENPAEAGIREWGSAFIAEDPTQMGLPVPYLTHL
jgi:hypothetical protein